MSKLLSSTTHNRCTQTQHGAWVRGLEARGSSGWSWSGIRSHLWKWGLAGNKWIWFQIYLCIRLQWRVPVFLSPIWELDIFCLCDLRFTFRISLVFEMCFCLYELWRVKTHEHTNWLLLIAHILPTIVSYQDRRFKQILLTNRCKVSPGIFSTPFLHQHHWCRC